MLFMIVLVNHSGFSGRGISIAKNLIENPKNVFVSDASVAQRGIAVSTGILSIAQGNILGHGIGTSSYVAYDIISDTYLGNIWSKAVSIMKTAIDTSYAHTSERKLSASLLSSFAQYTIELGFIFIILLFWLYFNIGSQSYVKIVRVTSLLYLIASFSILFPPLWLLLASTDIRNSFWLYPCYNPIKSQKK